MTLSKATPFITILCVAALASLPGVRSRVVGQQPLLARNIGEPTKQLPRALSGEFDLPKQYEANYESTDATKRMPNFYRDEHAGGPHARYGAGFEHSASYGGEQRLRNRQAYGCSQPQQILAEHCDLYH